MLLESRAVEPFFKNGFVLGCETSQEGVIIDPGDEVNDLLAIVERTQLAIKYILLTHAHVDHVTGVAKCKEMLDAPICLHRDDLFLYNGAVQQGALFGLRVDPLPPIDHYYDELGPLAGTRRSCITRRVTVPAESACRWERPARQGRCCLLATLFLLGQLVGPTCLEAITRSCSERLEKCCCRLAMKPKFTQVTARRRPSGTNARRIHFSLAEPDVSLSLDLPLVTDWGQ